MRVCVLQLRAILVRPAHFIDSPANPALVLRLLLHLIHINALVLRIYNSITSGVSYSFFLSHASKICIMVCMVVGKMRRVFGLSSTLQFVCAEA